jgi:hypothetical protein
MNMLTPGSPCWRDSNTIDEFCAAHAWLGQRQFGSICTVVPRFMDRRVFFRGLPEMRTYLDATNLAPGIGDSVAVVKRPVLVHPVVLTRVCPLPPGPTEMSLAKLPQCVASRRGLGVLIEGNVLCGVIVF